MTEKKYHITTRVNDETTDFQVPIDDPFVNHTSTTTTTFSWSDRFRILFGMKSVVKTTIIIDADRDTVMKVMNLDRFNLETVEGDSKPV